MVQVDEALKVARAKQILDHRRMQALEIAREKKEFERIIKLQLEAAERDTLYMYVFKLYKVKNTIKNFII